MIQRWRDTIYARYFDGLFTGFRNIDNGGNPHAALVDTNTPNNNMVARVLMGPSTMHYACCTTVSNEYDLQTTSFNPIVPEPGTLTLLGVGLAALGMGRRIAQRE